MNDVPILTPSKLFTIFVSVDKMVGSEFEADLSNLAMLTDSRRD